ncbi:DUF5753 domain-containing protein [Streptomyces sp. UNOB3_S3]|uniref:DUF5753 domain-containing protein n=1 Tax=Streptomyces sp. UNOB3_S3 TaxID=2871682 RepID=UPI0027E31488|nr:DUF5753 domain-containing protein [Streptomyces sp. UNOB3_S3]
MALSTAPPPVGTDELENQVAARIGRQELLLRDPAPNVRIILDESVLRRLPADSKMWQDQLTHIVHTSTLPNMTIQVLPFKAGVHYLMGGSLSLLWLPDGHAVAYLEGAKSARLTDDPQEVAQLRLAYDRVRDMALSPMDSLTFIKHLEDGTS